MDNVEMNLEDLFRFMNSLNEDSFIHVDFDIEGGERNGSDGCCFDSASEGCTYSFPKTY